jgi:hypothetical protein
MKPTRVDHCCLTPDGILCRVRNISAAGNMELMPLDGRQGEKLYWPAAELKRVPDPTKQKPPIEGMPTERPRCPTCLEQLRPTVRTETNGKYGWERRYTKRQFVRWNAYRQLFCTLACALKFAVAAHEAGVRLVKR